MWRCGYSLILLLCVCACTAPVCADVAAPALPHTLPYVPPLEVAVPAGAALPTGLAPLVLPGIHEDVLPRADNHADVKHGTDAQRARDIIRDPRSRCQWYSCNGNAGDGASVLRACTPADSSSVTALQFVWADLEGRWHEGTAFLQDEPGKLARWLNNRGCMPATGEVHVPQYPADSLWWGWVQGSEIR